MSRVAMLRDWKGVVDAYTLRLVDAIPEAMADFRAHKNQLSTLEIVTHLAESEYEMIGDLVRTRHFDDPRRKLIAPKNVTTGRQVLKDVHQSTDTLLRACTEELLDEPVGFPESETTVTVLLIVRAMIEHQIHHRGQLITYLRMNDREVPLRWRD